MNPTLYIDLGSPYAYLAFERAASVFGAPPRLQPVLLGGIFRLRGWGSWSQTARKEERKAEIEGRARSYGLPPVRWPLGWPPDGLAAMRAATWAMNEGGLFEFARAVFRRQFAEGLDMPPVDGLAEIATAAGLRGHELARAIEQPEIKDQLKSATAEAWEDGVRGIPSVEVGGEIFFGDDQLEVAARTMTG